MIDAPLEKPISGKMQVPGRSNIARLFTLIPRMTMAYAKEKHVTLSSEVDQRYSSNPNQIYGIAFRRNGRDAPISKLFAVCVVIMYHVYLPM